MVSTLEKIIKFINENNLKPMTKWSQRVGASKHNRGGNWAVLRKKIRKILEIVSGNEIVEMLKGVLHQSEIKQLSKKEETEAALENLANCYKKTDLKKRWHFARALKESNMHYTSARKYGFRISRKLWENCEDGKERNPGGAKPISSELREAIRKYLIEKSNIASNRLVVNKDVNDADYKECVPARYLTSNQMDLYNQFPLRDQLNRKTFVKYMKLSGEFKNPHRWTDLCDHCEKAKKIKLEIIEYLKKLEYVYEGLLNIKDVCSFLEQKKTNLISEISAEDTPAKRDRLNVVIHLEEQVKDYKVLLFHQMVAKCQRDAYNDHRTKEKLRGKILIDVDYKEKLVIGISQRQTNYEWFEQSANSRTCLGFGVYYVNEEDEVKLINFDIISNDLKEGANESVRGFTVLREQKFFVDLEKKSKDWIIWMDCGKHFRNDTVMSYLLGSLAEDNINVNINFFCEKHGKNSRDAHFSMVSKFVDYASLSFDRINKTRLINSEDIVSAIVEGQKRANENKIVLQIKDPAKKREPVTTYAVALDDPNEKYIHSIVPTIKIDKLESFYNYRSIGTDFEIVSSVISNHNDYNKLELKYNENDAILQYDVITENASKKRVIGKTKFSTINSKRDRIRKALKKIKLDKPNNPENQELFNYFCDDSDNFDYDNDNDEDSNCDNNNDNTSNSNKDNNDNNNDNVNDNNNTNANNNVYNNGYNIDNNNNEVLIGERKKMPQNCRETKRGKKLPCNKCLAPCKIEMNRLFDSKNPAGQTELQMELKAHNHAAYRSTIVNGVKIARTTKEGRYELAEHYIYQHNQIKPC